MLKKAYIGSPGSGKTYKLLDDLKDLQIRQIFNKKSTLVMILKGEENPYRRALPEATFCIDREEVLQGDFNAIVIDTVNVDQETVQKLTQHTGTLPKNILWTFQSAREVLVLLDVRVNNIMAYLSEIDEDILKTNKCVVLEIKTDEPSNK